MTRIAGASLVIALVASAALLAAAVPGAVFEELPCGHNECPRAWPTIEPFLTRVVLG